MTTNQELEPAPEQPASLAERKVGRRGVLKMFGIGALGVAPLPILPAILRTVFRPGPAPVHPDLNAARAPSGRVRRWTMVIDLRYCDGCQGVDKPPQCTAGCIEGHFAPEPMEWIQVFEFPLPGGGTQFVPAPCQQCQNAPCTNVCPVGATFATPEGSILIDQDRCIGCRICMAACPYDRRFFNWGNPPVPEDAQLAHYDIEHQTPARRGTVMKCDFCPDMARAGVLPYCAQGCPNKAIYYGDLEEDVATNGKDIVSVSRFLSEHQAYNLKEDMGTKPRVYYIPGHGELAGRDSAKKGRLATVWPWTKKAKGADTWKR
ncbi:MAG: 4Fe-4S dicluster domain-containing protein [Dehalococcoidia bacterium]|nr:MAG: 4Fe-4S dicluster domain-containing protein [Dehalococcoidia bacterium]